MLSTKSGRSQEVQGRLAQIRNNLRNLCNLWISCFSRPDDCHSGALMRYISCYVVSC